MSTELWLDFLGIRLDSEKAAGLKLVLNLLTPDNGEEFTVELSNSTLTSIKGFLSKKPDLTITVNRTDLETVMGGAATFDGLIAEGKAKFEGDRSGFDKLRTMLDVFTPDFEMMPGTRKVQTAASAPTLEDPFEQREVGSNTD